MTASPHALPRRRFGRHADELSIVGFGGIIVKDMPQPAADRLVAEAVDSGVNYFDIAPTYGDAELKLGPALRPWRDRVFLACKTTKRDKAGAAAELRQSLQRLHTDHFDLYQLHAITKTDKDVDAVFARGGAMEAFIEARQAGLVRYIGFSAHSIEAALAALSRFEFDSILYPVNFVTRMIGKFDEPVLVAAKARGAARLAIKALALHPWAKDDPAKQNYPHCWYRPIEDPRQAELALRWTLSQEITAALPPGHAGLFRMCVDFAARYRPITSAEEAELRQTAVRLTPIFSAAAG